MKEERSFSQEEFAQFIVDKVERVEGRLKGFHFVINAIANELRNSDPALARRLSEMIEDQARQEDPSASTIEIVELYVGILSHGTIPPSSEQQ